MNKKLLNKLIQRLDALIDGVHALLPARPAPTHWHAHAFSWRYAGDAPYLHPIDRPHRIRLEELHGIEEQKTMVVSNTEHFLQGLPANNILLWGSRGTGKSSLIKALLNAYADRGLRLIEVDKHHLRDLPDLEERLAGRQERFIVFCDDLSFESDDASYKALKVALDGSLAAPPDNLVIYATSNRRQLMPEYMSENRLAKVSEGELHLADVTEEKLSLVERFGIRLAFHPFNQSQYLNIVEAWLQTYGLEATESVRQAALRWALERGTRSGRSAWQFAKYHAGESHVIQSGVRDTS